ncbi:hypothetical protein V525_14865 [Gordonia alkanivorans CGMCC 6845]|uniref:Uncharacterized protein n=1 Tax=Gordonia alkanivorans CGMCC 6845 TaxID=1423140 RepID=W9D9S6_9ACTN|nr:hypothetical protein V525_14865 [Gordonia alkanivorans CGMCC 6845]
MVSSFVLYGIRRLGRCLSVLGIDGNAVAVKRPGHQVFDGIFDSATDNLAHENSPSSY